MLAKMKALSNDLEAEGPETPPPQETTANDAAFNNDRPVYNSIVKKLTKTLKPEILEVYDESAGHAGHAGMEGKTSDESHFSLRVVSSAFEGLNRVKRHQVIYSLLEQEMKHIHAMSINAKTPQEEAV